MKESTNAEIEQRVDAVVDLLGEGRTHAFIVRYASEHWDVGSRCAERYISRATDRVRDEISATLEDKVARLWNRYERIYAKQVEKGDERGARATLDSMRDMFMPKQMKVEHTGAMDLRGTSTEDLVGEARRLADEIERG